MFESFKQMCKTAKIACAVVAFVLLFGMVATLIVKNYLAFTFAVIAIVFAIACLFFKLDALDDAQVNDTLNKLIETIKAELASLKKDNAVLETRVTELAEQNEQLKRKRTPVQEVTPEVQQAPVQEDADDTLVRNANKVRNKAAALQQESAKKRGRKKKE